MSKTVGWFVQVPRSLRDKFDELYPGRRNKKILTITAIKHAIDKAPKSLYNLYKGDGNAVADGKGDVPGSSTELARGSEDESLSGERSDESGATG